LETKAAAGIIHYVMRRLNIQAPEPNVSAAVVIFNMDTIL